MMLLLLYVLHDFYRRCTIPTHFYIHNRLSELRMQHQSSSFSRTNDYLLLPPRQQRNFKLLGCPATAPPDAKTRQSNSLRYLHAEFAGCLVQLVPRVSHVRQCLLVTPKSHPSNTKTYNIGGPPVVLITT